MVASLYAAPVLADTPSFCPTDDAGKLDASKEVDRNALAAAMLDQAGVTAGLADRLRAIIPTGADQPTAFEVIVMAGDGLCNVDGKPAASGQIRCSDAERATLKKTAVAYHDVLRDKSLVGAPDDIFPATSFFAGTSRLTCKGTKAAETAAAPGKKVDGGPQLPRTIAITNFRVRGTAPDILIEHGGAGYDDATKAKLDIGSDSGKRTKSVIGAVGYAFPVKMPADKADLTTATVVPFFAVDLEESRKTGEAKVVTNNKIAFGTAFTYQQLYSDSRNNWGAWYVGLSPQEQINYVDHSHMVGVDLLVRPAALLFGVLPITRTQRIGTAPIGWRLVLDARWNTGWFVKRGTRDFDDSRNFTRAGGRVGLGFSTIGSFKYPIDFTVTDTTMWALTGKPSHLGQFQSDFTVYFTDDKIFGLDVSYSRGRIEDLDARDKKWAIGLTAKY